MAKKYFSVEEANALLPNIQLELYQLQEMKREFESKFLRLRQLKASLPKIRRSEAPDLFFSLECEMEFLHMQAETHIGNLERTGAQLKDVGLGLVDFPALIDGKEVLLCWKQGEERIMHYHGIHEGMAGRKPLWYG